MDPPLSMAAATTAVESCLASDPLAPALRVHYHLQSLTRVFASLMHICESLSHAIEDRVAMLHRVIMVITTVSKAALSVQASLMEPLSGHPHSRTSEPIVSTDSARHDDKHSSERSSTSESSPMHTAKQRAWLADASWAMLGSPSM